MERSRILLKMGVEARTRLLRLQMIRNLLLLLLEESGDLMMMMMMMMIIHGDF